MEKNRGSSFNQQEDELLCWVCLEISQDPIGKNYNKKNERWENRSTRSLQSRINTITYVVINLKSCITQVENMHASKCNTFDSPTLQSPRIPSFSINLSSDDGRSSSRPVGSKKAKLKRKTTEGNNMAVDTLISSDEQILDLLIESATSTEKKAKEKTKILLKDLTSIGDINTREYIRSEQKRIIRKRRQEQQQQQQPSVTQNLFGQYFEGFRVSGANLPDYLCCCNI
ncbi:hypothetical protein N665_2219s0008 [Sinapis alba]|nr:hypothetical protein N665_2219s0008 [Sinapis alba]